MRLFLSLMVLFGHSVSMASIYSPLTGKFTPVSGDCVKYNRAYISIEQSPWGGSGAFGLMIQWYGQDAALDEVMLGQGTRQAPGTSAGTHGVATQSWETQFDGRVLVSHVQLSRPSVGYHSEQFIQMTLMGNELTYESTDSYKRFACKMIRQ